MNLLKYMAFVKAVEYGSFTRAAEFLHYSQSGVSRMINDLEKEWNLTLLERNRGGVRLTSDGCRLLPYAEALCASYRQLCEQVDDLNGLKSGIIRIGTISSVATHWLPNIIQAFQKDYPGIEYELLLGDYTEIESWIRTGRVDCGFVILPTDPELESIPLARDELFAVLPEDHPLCACERVPLAELGRESFLLLEKGERSEVSELFERNHIVPNARFTTWDDYAVMSMVESGLGVSILPGLILRRIPYRIVLRPLDVDAYREIGLALRDRKNISLAVKRFLDYLDRRNET